MSSVAIHLLGSLQVKLGGEPVTRFESQKVRALLAYLAAEAGKPQARGSLAGLLWPDWPEEAAQKNLRHSLYSLRKSLGNPGWIEADRQAITLVPGEGCQVDILVLEQALSKFREKQTADERLHSAVELYRGPFLEGFTLDDSPDFEAWIVSRRAYHAQQALEALGLLAGWHEEQGEYEQAERYARRQLEIEPWWEEAHRQVMRALAQQGKRSQAVVQFETCRKALREGLGIEPGEETTRLFEQIRAGRFPAAKPEALTPETADLRHNLPRPLTRFIGRETAIARVKGLLAEYRLVTLAGPGGVGKTRLAIRIAEEVFERYKNGAYFCDLAAVRDPGMVVPAVVKSLEIYTEHAASLEEALLSFLRNRQVLLVLDNCEHVIAACAELVLHLLQQCAQVTLLATSREVLALEGERIFSLTPMAFLAAQDRIDLSSLREIEASQFFEDRAMAVQPNFEITERNARAVASICQRLDGIPLAIELAAARLRVLSLEQIELMLQDCFRLLTSGQRGALPRQQTLQASIEWSHELLSEPERVLFRRLSVFAGGCSLEGAQQVCGGEDLDEFQVIELLDLLASKSLVVVTPGKTPRYRMLETIREYAQQKLVEAGELTEFRDRHLDYMLHLAEEFEQKIRPPKSALSIHIKLDPEIANLRLAISWSLGGEEPARVALVIRIIEGLGDFWHNRDMLPLAHQWCRTGLEMLPVEKTDWEIERARGILYVSGELDDPLTALQECVDIFQKYGDWFRCALVQNEIASQYLYKGKEYYPLATAFAREGIATMRASGDQVRLAEVLLAGAWTLYRTEGRSVSQPLLDEAYALSLDPGNWLANGYARVGYYLSALEDRDYATARKLMQESLVDCQQTNQRHGAAELTGMLGVIDYFLGNFDAMETAFRKGLFLSKELGMVTSIRFSSRNLGVALLRQGKYEQAWMVLLENLNAVPNDEAGNQPLVLFYMAGICLETRRMELSGQLFGFAAPRVEERFGTLIYWDQVEVERVLTNMRAQRDEPAFAAAWEAGRQMTLEQALRLANETALPEA